MATEIIDFSTRFDDGDIERAMLNLAASVDNVTGKIDNLGNTASDSFEQAEQGVAGYSAQIELLQKRNLSLAASIERVNRLQATQGKLTADQVRRVQGLTKEVQENNAAIANYKNRITDVTALSKSFDTAGQSLKLTSSQAQNLSFQLQDVFTQVGAGTSVMQTLIQQGPQITSIFGGVGNTFRFFGRQALGALKSLFSLRNGVTALSGALVALTGIAVATYFRKSQEEGDKFEQSMAALGGRFDIVVGRVFNFGESIAKVFSGEAMRGEAVENLIRIFSGYNDELDRAADTARKFTEVQQVLGRAANQFIVSEGQSLRVIDRLRASVDNENLSLAGRTRALQQAGTIERQLETERIRAATLQVSALKARIEQESAAGGISVENGKLVADAERKVIDLMREAANRERSDQSTLRGLRKQRQEDLDREREKVEALNDAYNKLLDRLSERAEKARIGEFLGTDRLNAEREAALREVDAFVNEIAAAATAAGRSLPEGFASDVQDLVQAVETELRRGVDKLREQDGGVFSQLLLPKDKGRDLDKEITDAFNRLESVFNNNRPLLQRIKDGIAQAFGLSREELNEAAAQLGGAFQLAFGNFTSALDSITDAQIAREDALIAHREENIDKLQRQLDIELDRERDGYANSVGALQDKIDAENVLLEQAQAKRQALEEKAARRTLLLNSIQQASEATLTIVRLLSSGAKLGPFGFIAAAAVGVSTVFSILAQAKAQAAKFSQVPGFKTGTEFLNGPGDGKSDSILVRASRGERILTAADNAALGGSQLPNKELVRYALIGQEIERGAAAKSRANAEAINAHKYAQQDFAGLTKGQMKEVAGEIISYLKTRPVRKYDKNGGEVVEFMEGAAKVRQRVRK